MKQWKNKEGVVESFPVPEVLAPEFQLFYMRFIISLFFLFSTIVEMIKLNDCISKENKTKISLVGVIWRPDSRCRRCESSCNVLLSIFRKYNYSKDTNNIFIKEYRMRRCGQFGCSLIWATIIAKMYSTKQSISGESRVLLLNSMIIRIFWIKIGALCPTSILLARLLISRKGKNLQSYFPGLLSRMKNRDLLRLVEKIKPD